MSYFQFKQFGLKQDRCAMKVGTDGVLLGAWATIATTSVKVLDIGAGTALISLMLAQRFPNAKITALELNKIAFEQMCENIQQSPFSSQIKTIEGNFLTYNPHYLYDFIVSNPPYFKTPNTPIINSRNQARQQLEITLYQLLEHARNLLNPTGSIQLILPYQTWLELEQKSMELGFYLQKITFVKGTAQSTIKRVLINLCFIKKEPEKTILVLEKMRHQYTPEYQQLIKDFIIKIN